VHLQVVKNDVDKLIHLTVEILSIPVREFTTFKKSGKSFNRALNYIDHEGFERLQKALRQTDGHAVVLPVVFQPAGAPVQMQSFDTLGIATKVFTKLRLSFFLANVIRAIHVAVTNSVTQGDMPYPTILHGY